MVKEQNCLTTAKSGFFQRYPHGLSPPPDTAFTSLTTMKKDSHPASHCIPYPLHTTSTRSLLQKNYGNIICFCPFFFVPFIFLFTFNLNPQNLSWYKISPLMLIHSSLQRSAASVAKHAPPPLLLVQLVQKRAARSVLRRFLLEFEAGKRRLRM